ncbi:DUF2194 domain-containing protein [Cohnella mopanensis]|uniref:DUF2194 domain-containing protein n=1 Tax=Cohnella mopanensis TaxID=2911966 RepID=UPI001EF9AA82|nr:DUF2194 domain-containing protein [Cohnella mopanensis]
MKEQFKLDKQIYYILGFVLLLSLAIQMTRLNSILHFGGELNGWASPASTGGINPLSEDEISRLDEEKLLVLYDSNETYSTRMMNNLVQTLGYMKKQHDVIGMDQYKGSGEDYDSIIIADPGLSKLANNEWLERYVERGGNVLFTTIPLIDSSLYRIYRKLGINEIGDYILSSGLVFQTNVLVNYKGEEFPGEAVENSSLRLQLGQEARIHAKAKDGLPLLWDISYGKGIFVVFNGSMLQEKTSRGFLAGAISLLKEDNIYPIMNMKLMYIDDFPAPLPVGIQEDIYAIYKRDLTRFFKEVWWPDMLRLGARYQLKYTGVVIQSYDDNVEPPFQRPTDSDNINLIMFGRELLKRGGEIGIHGYNHQSLISNHKAQTVFGYKKWKSLESMEESIRTVIQYVHTSIPKYGIHNYVPPSNVLGEDGREALKAAWPELKSISSVYSEDTQHLSYVQEFEVAADGIVELPRVTSGFKADVFNEWAAANAASSIGVFSHFIHPDDILDHERSFPYTWEQLFAMFSDFMDTIDRKYGWLRSMTATEASAELKRYSLSEPHFVYSGNRIDGYINQYSGGKLYYYLRSGKKISRTENCRLTRIDSETYLVEADNERFSIELGGKS